MKVNECMCKNVVYATPDTTLCNVAKMMADNHVGCIPICDTNKKVVGLVTDRDILLRSVACDKDCKTTPVSDIMTTKVFEVSPNAEVSEATKMMCDCQVRRIPVVENEKIIGIITMGDLSNHPQVSKNEVSETVEGICRCKNNPKNAE